MRRLTLALVLTLTALGASAHENFSVNGDECTANNFRWDDSPTYVATETLDGRGLRSIKANVAQSPISVIGDGNGRYSIDICKAAANRADLDVIRVTLDGDELRATGPDNKRWTVIYKIHVPRGADVQVEAKNGPVAFRDVDGTIVARTQNGPLSLKNVSGNVDATAKNGPISIVGGSGNVKVEARNGPLSVQLDGNAWIGTLDASTQNGPLSVKLPRGYNSGVVVESSGRSPVSCRAEGCEKWNRDGDDDDRSRRIQLGNGPADVRLSTVNGPVTIKDE